MYKEKRDEGRGLDKEDFKDDMTLEEGLEGQIGSGQKTIEDGRYTPSRGRHIQPITEMVNGWFGGKKPFNTTVSSKLRVRSDSG